MKRNKQSSRAMRQRSKGSKPAAGKSRYGRKVRAHNQMYSIDGKFCCGHRLVPGGAA